MCMGCRDVARAGRLLRSVARSSCVVHFANSAESRTHRIKCICLRFRCAWRMQSSLAVRSRMAPAFVLRLSPLLRLLVQWQPSAHSLLGLAGCCCWNACDRSCGDCTRISAREGAAQSQSNCAELGLAEGRSGAVAFVSDLVRAAA